MPLAQGHRHVKIKLLLGPWAIEQSGRSIPNRDRFRKKMQLEIIEKYGNKEIPLCMMGTIVTPWIRTGSFRIIVKKKKPFYRIFEDTFPVYM